MLPRAVLESFDWVSKYKNKETGRICFGMRHSAMDCRSLEMFCELQGIDFDCDYYGACFVGFGHRYISDGELIIIDRDSQDKNIVILKSDRDIRGLEYEQVTQ